jgi:hypothetical protein
MRMLLPCHAAAGDNRRMRYHLRTLLILLAVGPSLVGCQVEHGGAGIGGNAPDDTIYYDPEPEFHSATEAGKAEASTQP